MDNLKKKGKWNWITILPVLSCLGAIVFDLILPDTPQLINVASAYPMFKIVMAVCAGIFLLCSIVTAVNQEYRLKYTPKTPFYAVLILVLNVANIITKKTTMLPTIYFPTFDRILTVFVTQIKVLLTCTAYSMRLLVLGALFGTTIGFVTGVFIGWNKKAHYWLFPCIRFIGPIPTTIWIPIAMLLFPSLIHASVFIVALSMWFPITFLTSSGIQNVDKKLFEVGMTLGAKTGYQVLHIAIPAAMPQIFVGFFYGMVSSLISLMSAELIVAKYGLGWFINWQQQIMGYDQVYAGFLIIALICFVLFKLIFYVQRKVLNWQKGAIRW